ncbi:MAG: thiamine pyrophosphate-dependent enzyme [Breznakibacter sp.]
MKIQKQFLLGAEAIAQGAIDGGMSGIYAYPGTPSTEITEFVQGSAQAIKQNIHSQWSANEKTAMEAALGMSYAGKRTMVCMKHVGLNVAADVFMNAAITGINGGMIITVADDPSMHSSQNEQDSRYYGRFAQIPILEPSNQQEAYDMAYAGFELSEQLNVPIMMRITTRLSHSRAGVTNKMPKPENALHLPNDPHQFILLPAIARRQYHKLVESRKLFEQSSENLGYNQLFDGHNKRLGIIACGLAYNYLMEHYPNGCDYPVLKLTQYPMPRKMIVELYNLCDELLVLEDGYPMVEELMAGYCRTGKNIHGRLDGSLPREGELNPDLVGKALGLEVSLDDFVPNVVMKRPPSLCVGCGHRDAYDALNEAVQSFGYGRVFSDIGCYTLGALAPFEAINSCVDMGASITMAKGAADAGLIPAVAVIGDSTFTHSGMTGLLDAINEKSPITVIISDNETTAMTGGQTSSGHNRIESICQGLGVEPEHIRVMVPHRKNYEEMVRVMKEELAYPGVSVIIPRRECIQTLSRRKRAEVASKSE